MPRVTAGLELVTSDGDLASKLQRSMRRLSSEFSVRVHGELSRKAWRPLRKACWTTAKDWKSNAAKRLGRGVESLVFAGGTRCQWKDVRQLFERQGALVSRVLRTQLGSLALDRHLSRGRFRELSAEELEALLATADGSVVLTLLGGGDFASGLKYPLDRLAVERYPLIHVFFPFRAQRSL